MFLQFIQPLLADIGEVIGAVIGVIAFIAWIIKNVAAASKQAGPARNRPQAAQRPPQVAGQGEAVRPAGQQADALRNQVEEFLRRAGQGQQGERGGAPQRRPQPAVSEIEVLLDDESVVPQSRPLSKPLRPADSRFPGTPQPLSARTSNISPSDKRPARRSVTPRKRKTLAERADERAAARSRTIAEQAGQLGQRIISEDQQFDVQLKAKFDHSVGTLASNSVSNVELEPVPSDSPAGQIAAMLANPTSMRQAIILNEILRPPTDRW